MELIDIVTKLIGPTEPVGDSVIDSERLLNLRKMAELNWDITQIIYRISESSNRPEHSVQVAAGAALAALESLSEYVYY